MSNVRLQGAANGEGAFVSCIIRPLWTYIIDFSSIGSS